MEKDLTASPEAKNVIESALSKIQIMQGTGDIRLPKDYSPENAVRAAMLIIAETKDKNGKTAMETCTRPSIANAMLKMVVWGLNPHKKQCDFIVYGNELTCQPEYAGHIAMAKRYGDLKNIVGRAVFKGDTFNWAIDTKTGRKYITEHTQTLESLDSDVIAAYAITELNDGTFDTEIMTRRQIETAWNQGPMKGNSPAHKNFPDQMSIKTVITRSCKLLIRGSSDAVLFDDNEDLVRESSAKVEVRQQINDRANTKTIQMPVKPEAKQEIKEEPKPEPVKEPEQVSLQMEEKAPFE